MRWFRRWWTPTGVSLGAILLAALILRLAGITFGLPSRYHPDEAQHVADAARMLAERTLIPPSFNNPPLYKYLLMLADAGFVGLALIRGNGSLPELTAALASDPSPLYLLGRVVSAAAGAVNVLAVYLLGEAAYGRRVGIIASIFMAVAFLPVRESHFATNDSLVGLLMTIALLGAVRMAKDGKASSYALGAVAAGMAFSAKYTGALAVLPLTLAHLHFHRRQGSSVDGKSLRRLAGLWAMTVGAALATFPPLLMDPLQVVRGVEGSVYAYGRQGFEGWLIDPAGGYWYYLKSLGWGLGLGLCVLVLAGVVQSLRRGEIFDWLLALPVLLFFAFMGRQEMFFARLMLPVVPILLVLAARGLESGVSYLHQRWQALAGAPWRREVAVASLAMVAAFPSAADSWRFDTVMARDDTRSLAREWIEANIPAGAAIALDWPYHGPSLATVDEPEPGAAATYRVLLVGGHGLADHSLEFYRSQGFEYLVTSSNISQLSLSDTSKSTERATFYASLARDLELVYEVQPTALGGSLPFVFDELYGPAVSLWERALPGPVIRVYRLERADPIVAAGDA